MSQEARRYLLPEEALSTHVLPVTREASATCGSPALQMPSDKVSNSQAIRMAGNAMSLPCVGAMLLCAGMGLTSR